MSPPLQIRQVARLRSTTCNLQGLSPTQRSTQTTPSRDLTLGVMQLVTLRSPQATSTTNAHPDSFTPPGKGTRTSNQGNPYRRSSSRSVKGQSGKTVEGRTQVAVLPRCVRAIKPIGCGCAGQVPRGKILHRHEHACSTSTSRHDTSRHAASCGPRVKSLHRHEHARRTGTHAT